MKTIFSLLFLLTSSSLLAQESIGFTDSTDFKYLIDYRLPDWGYSSFSINTLSGNIDGSNWDNDYQLRNETTLLDQRSSSRENFSSSFGLVPRYEFFQQSEERTLNLQTQFIIGGSFDKNEQEETDLSGTSTQESSASQRRFDHEFSGNGLWYLNGDFFVQSGLAYSASYRNNYNKSDVDQGQTQNYKSFSRNLRLIPSVGIGFGRLRNVTPVLRALRMNERYKALGNSSLNNDEIIYAAKQFTQYSSYNRIYDRPLKYFWEDMNTGVNQKLDGIGIFDTFYLNDVFDENLGSRFEGYSVSVDITYILQSRLDRNENRISDSFDRDLDIRRQAVVELSGLWYKNLNLDHQLSFTSNWDLALPINKENPDKWELYNFNDFSWLWVMADRFLLENSLIVRYLNSDRKDVEDFDSPVLITDLRSNLTYFIENQLAISGAVFFGRDYRLTKIQDMVFPQSQRSEVTNWNWGITVSLRYYFNRNLF